MNYARIYDQLIDKARNRVLTGYFESHHVVPRCLGGSNRKSNLVNLTPEEHVFAHRLLCRIYPTNGRLAYAVVLLVGSRQGREARKMYAADKQRIRSNAKAKQAAEDAEVMAMLKKMYRKNGPRKPKPVDPVYISPQDYPRFLKEGWKWITLNDSVQKMVRPDEVPAYVAAGWRLGRKPKAP